MNMIHKILSPLLRALLFAGLCVVSQRAHSQNATLEIGDDAAPCAEQLAHWSCLPDIVDDTRLGGYYNITPQTEAKYGNHTVVACTYTVKAEPDSKRGMALVALRGNGAKATMTDCVFLGNENEKHDLAEGYTQATHGVTYKLSCTLADTAIVVTKAYDYAVPVTGAYRYESQGAMNATMVYMLGKDGTFVSPLPDAEFKGNQVSKTVGRLLLGEMLPDNSRETIDMKISYFCNMMIDALYDNKERTPLAKGIFYSTQRTLYNLHPDEYLNWIYNNYSRENNTLPLAMLQESCFSNCVDLGDLEKRVKKMKDKKERKFFQDWMKEIFNIK